MRLEVTVTNSITLRTSPSAKCEISAVARRSKPMAQLSAVVSATAISTPGQRGRCTRSNHMRANAPTPIASVGQWVSPICCRTPQMSEAKCSPWASETPSSLFNCESAMMMAAALVKPTITGCEMKLTIAPRRNAPRASCITPAISARVMASAMN